MLTSIEVQLVRRPDATAAVSDFDLVEAPVPSLKSGQVRVENRYLSVDPYMRARMNDRPSYCPPWPLNAPLDGDAVGIVTESREPTLPSGQWVLSDCGWRERYVAGRSDVRPLEPPPAGYGYSAYLGILGATGLTAYLGVMDVLAPRPGEVMLITTAAGAVGGTAGQMCRALGAHVIGSTSTPAKVAHVISRYGFDAAFDYRNEQPAQALARLAPDGIDGMFDNVGGTQLEAGIEAMRTGGRIAKCGAIGDYNSPHPAPGPPNMHHFFGKRLVMRGFLVSDHHDRIPEFQRKARDWLADGQLVADETVFSGIDSAVPAFLQLFAGHNIGKTVISLPVTGGF